MNNLNCRSCERKFNKSEVNKKATQMILTPARPADETRLDELIVYTKDVLHVFDRGYFNFVKFDTYSKKGIRFATRIKSNTVVNIIE